MILLDANVLVYAVGGDHPLKPAATGLLELIGSAPLRTTREAIIEFLHVFARPGRPRVLAAEIAADYFEMLGPVVPIADEAVSVGVGLWQQHQRLDVPDAILAATAIDNDATLISADKAFGDVPDLKFVDLADPNLLERLGAGAK